MGQHYFELQSEKNSMQIAALQAKQAQLETQENNLKDRLRISQDLHDSIGSTLSSIAVYSQVAKIHGEKNEHENLHELLEKISGTSNEMVGEMNDIVWAINPRNDSFSINTR
jgi:signal transduction histidine kinase